jgi:hypothetical protein
MANVRFPYKAYYRRLSEAETLGDAQLGRWLYDRSRAKRLAASAVLKKRARLVEVTERWGGPK